MVQSQFSEQEIREVLARAEQIHQGRSAESESEIVIRAAEEAGLPREAVEQAIRERFDIPAEIPKPGELVFARSSDGRYYVAEVLEAEKGIRVRFSKGGEVNLTLQDLRPCNFLPGARVVCPWPDWGWWTCTVISYNVEKRKVKVTDGWGSYQTFSVGEIRLDPPQKKLSLFTRFKESIATWGLDYLFAALVGAGIMWLVLR